MSEMSPLHESALFHQRATINDAVVIPVTAMLPNDQKPMPRGVTCKKCGSDQMEETERAKSVCSNISTSTEEDDDNINVVDDDEVAVSSPVNPTAAAASFSSYVDKLETMVSKCGNAAEPEEPSSETSQSQQPDDDALHHDRRLSPTADNGIHTNSVTSTTSLGSSVGMVRVVPKWQVIENQGLGHNRVTAAGSNGGGGPIRRKSSSDWSDPLNDRARVTIQTDSGPKLVRIIRTKAERLGKTNKFRCPIAGCRYHKKESSRVYISKHFNLEHSDDYRSWRDIHVKGDAPAIIQIEEEEPPSPTTTPTPQTVPMSPSVGYNFPNVEHQQQQQQQQPQPQQQPQQQSVTVRMPQPIMPTQTSSMPSGTVLSWSQATRPPLCSSSVVQSAQHQRMTSAFVPVPGRMPVNQHHHHHQQMAMHQFPTPVSVPMSSHQVMMTAVPQTSCISPLMMSQTPLPASPGNVITSPSGATYQLMGSPPMQYQQVMPAQSPSNSPTLQSPPPQLPASSAHQLVFGGQQPQQQQQQMVLPPGFVQLQQQPQGATQVLAQSPSVQKYKVIQVVVPTRIANQVLNSRQRFQLLPAPADMHSGNTSVEAAVSAAAATVIQQQQQQWPPQTVLSVQVQPRPPPPQMHPQPQFQQMMVAAPSMAPPPGATIFPVYTM